MVSYGTNWWQCFLGPQGVGLISLFNTTVRFISDSTNFGLSMSAVRNISEDYDRKDEEKLKEGITLVRSWESVDCLIGLFCLYNTKSFA